MNFTSSRRAQVALLWWMLLYCRDAFEAAPLLNKEGARSLLWSWGHMVWSGPFKIHGTWSWVFISVFGTISPIIIGTSSLAVMHMYTHTHVYHHGISSPCVLGAAWGICYSRDHVLLWCKTMPGSMLATEWDRQMPELSLSLSGLLHSVDTDLLITLQSQKLLQSRLQPEFVALRFWCSLLWC